MYCLVEVRLKCKGPRDKSSSVLGPWLLKPEILGRTYTPRFIVHMKNLSLSEYL